MALKPSQMASVLEVLIPTGRTILQVGRPGIGKTSLYEQIAKKLSMKLIVKHPVIEDPTDYKGMPGLFTRDENGIATTRAKFFPFGDLEEMLDTKDETLVVFDDIGQAAVAVQGALMQVFLAKAINGHKLSKKVFLVAATNRRQDKAGVVGMIEPLKDRFSTILELEFDLNDWLNWAVDEKLPAVMVQFIRTKGADIMDPTKFKASLDMMKSPTPRSMAELGRMVPSLEKAGLKADDAVTVQVCEGAIGRPAAIEFLAYMRMWQELPTIDEILLNPQTARLPENQPDVLYAVMAMLAEHTSKDNMEEVITYIERVKRPEFKALCMRDAFRRNPNSMKCAAATKWLIKNAKLLGADKSDK